MTPSSTAGEVVAATPAPVAWGIAATGRIARKFAADLRKVPDARLASPFMAILRVGRVDHMKSAPDLGG